MLNRSRLCASTACATDALRRGDFSGTGVTIYDPASNPDPALRTPFPNNTIPANRIDLAALEMINRHAAPLDGGFREQLRRARRWRTTRSRQHRRQGQLQLEPEAVVVRALQHLAVQHHRSAVARRRRRRRAQRRSAWQRARAVRRSLAWERPTLSVELLAGRERRITRASGWARRTSTSTPTSVSMC